VSDLHCYSYCDGDDVPFLIDHCAHPYVHVFAFAWGIDCAVFALGSGCPYGFAFSLKET